jgi:hypothetical protein
MAQNKGTNEITTNFTFYSIDQMKEYISIIENNLHLAKQALLEKEEDILEDECFNGNFYDDFIPSNPKRIKGTKSKKDKKRPKIYTDKQAKASHENKIAVSKAIKRREKELKTDELANDVPNDDVSDVLPEVVYLEKEKNDCKCVQCLFLRDFYTKIIEIYGEEFAREFETNDLLNFEKFNDEYDFVEGVRDILHEM